MVSCGEIVVTPISLAGKIHFVTRGIFGSSGRPNRASILHSTAPAAPVPGGPGFVAQSALAFNPYSASNPPAFIGQTLYNAGGSYAYFEGPLTLPHGATITRFVVYYLDDSTSNLSAYLAKGAFDSTYGTVIATVNSTGAAATLRNSETTTISSPLIDNQSNSYWVELSLPANSSVRLAGVRVDYAFTNSLPAVLKP